ncbi:hypothetical protein ABK040_013137 [Willaertia magna]
MISRKGTNNFIELLLKLSNDEFYLILNILKEKFFFFLKFKKKKKQYHPTFIYFTYPQDDEENNENNEINKCIKQEPKWSIKNTLRSFNKIIVNDETLPKLFQLQKENDLSKITKKYEISNYESDCNLNHVIKLFSTETTKKRNIDVIEINLQNLTNINIYNKKTIIVNDKLGFNIKKLYINHFNTCSPFELYSLLSQFHSLESLELYFSFDSKNNGYNVNDKTSILVPVMYNLKHLSFDVQYLEYKSYKIITDILQLVPNLESIKFGIDSNINDELLNFIAKHCPKLKSFDNHRIDDRLTITDEGIVNFLKALPNLTYLDLISEKITGSFCKGIGKYGKNLKILRLYTGNDTFFGGGELLNLEALRLVGNVDIYTTEFIESIFKTAPNLKKIKLLYRIIKSFDKFNFNNLQSIYINQSEVERVFTTNNKLKKLTIRGENTCISKETIYNILKYCPNLEKFNYINNDVFVKDISLVEETKEALIEILKNPNNWPNLKVCRISKGLEEEDLFKNNIVNIRPSLKLCRFEPEASSSAPQSELEFVRFWLLDK